MLPPLDWQSAVCACLYVSSVSARTSVWDSDTQAPAHACPCMCEFWPLGRKRVSKALLHCTSPILHVE